MGGRGGSPNAGPGAAATAPAAAAASPDARQEFMRWLATPRDITADIVAMIDGRPKYSILLPDHDATIALSGDSFILRDVHTDQRIGTFKGQTARPILRQIAKFYGRRVEHSNESGVVTGYFGENVGDLRKTPAARMYGVK
jgi:hypothetical protein